MAEKRFTKEHEWVEKNDRITVGITDFAQDQLGDVVSIELPEIGSTFKQNDPMAIIDSTLSFEGIFRTFET